MAVNLSPLATVTTTATALSNLVLVTPQQVLGYQPQNGFITDNKTTQSQPSLLFHYEGEQTVTIESDITDHYIEDNTAIQDQVSLKPEIVTTHGFIGELNDIAPIGLQLAQSAVSKLTTISAYTPALSVTALIAYNEAFQAYQIAANAVAAGVSAWGTISGTSAGESVIGNLGLFEQPTQNRQQRAFQQFYGYWSNRILFTVQTPWAVFQNMAIRSLRAIQDAETRMITDFEVSFKRIRLATTASISQSQALNLQGRLNNQASAVQNNGTVPVVPSVPLNSVIGGN
jgi:hypothetical protein